MTREERWKTKGTAHCKFKGPNFYCNIVFEVTKGAKEVRRPKWTKCQTLEIDGEECVITWGVCPNCQSKYLVDVKIVSQVKKDSLDS